MNCILNDIATCNFHFSDYVWTLSVKCDYVLKQVQTFFFFNFIFLIEAYVQYNIQY